MRAGCAKRLVLILATITASVIISLRNLLDHNVVIFRYQRKQESLHKCSYSMVETMNHMSSWKSHQNVSGIMEGRQTVIENSNMTKLLTSASKPADGLYLQEPIDKHLFRYIHNPEMTCFHENRMNMDVHVVFFVPSALGNFDRREAIRRSYGKRDTWPVIAGGGKMVTVFMLGSTSDAGLQDKIDIESNKYGDIVQESFIDSYLNLTRKTIMGLKWVKSHCRHAEFAMKIDDDTSIIQRRIIPILRDAPRIRYTLGYVFKNPIVMRHKINKFYMSKAFYPNASLPPYSSGAGYIMSTDVVEAVFNVAITIPIFPWEDVFVGMCLQKLDIEPNHDESFLFRESYRNLLTAKRAESAEKYVIATNIPPRIMVSFYERFRIKES